MSVLRLISFCLAAALALLPLRPARALPLQSLTIEQAMQLAVAHAPLLEADAARLVAARADAGRAGALPDPKLVLGIDNLTVTGPRALQLGADEMTMRRIGVMQDWPSRRSRQARTAEADARVEETVQQRAATQLSVERAAALAWVECWLAEQRLGLLVELHGELDRAVAVADARLRGGEGSSSDALTARAARAQHDNEVTLGRAEVAAARAGLRRWLGDPGSLPLAPARTFDQLPLSPELLRASTDRQSLLRVWDARQRRVEASVATALAGKRPNLSFGLSYGARSAGLEDMVSFEVGVDLPLFPRGRQDRDIAARRAEVDAVAAEREEARRSQTEALERELALWQGNIEEIARYRASILPLARDRVAVALAAYSGGAPLQDWLQAQREEVEARLRLAQALGQRAKRWVMLATLVASEDAR